MKNSVLMIFNEVHVVQIEPDSTS